MKFTIKGFKAGSVYCGIKKNKKPDLALIFSEVPAAASAVFTKNNLKAAPVLLSMRNIKSGRASAIIANSGNANAATGKQGMKDAVSMAEAAALSLNIPAKDVLVCSTGVIGVRFPIDKIKAAVKPLSILLSEGGLLDAASGIMTTDTFKKTAYSSVKAGGRECGIFGMAKGSGMIHPDMATMLCFVLTDVSISGKLLAKAFKGAVGESFNSITVDGDTSTNDTAICLANGMAGNKAITGAGRDYDAFEKGLRVVLQSLAKQVVKDGEGASKFIEVLVKGARDASSAKKAAMSVARSSLVKTAVYGGDPNWGRVFNAVGYSGIKFREEKVKIFFGALKVVDHGVEIPGFNESAASKQISGKEVRITVDLGLGKASAKVWTCDLTEGYININAHYRT